MPRTRRAVAAPARTVPRPTAFFSAAITSGRMVYSSRVISATRCLSPARAPARRRCAPSAAPAPSAPVKPPQASPSPWRASPCPRHAHQPRSLYRVHLTCDCLLWVSLLRVQISRRGQRQQQARVPIHPLRPQLRITSQEPALPQMLQSRHVKASCKKDKALVAGCRWGHDRRHRFS